MVLGVVLGDFVWVEWRDGGEVGVARWVTCRIWECRNEMGYLPDMGVQKRDGYLPE